MLATPFVLVIAAGIFGYKIWRDDPKRHEEVSRVKTLALYEEVLASNVPIEVKWSFSTDQLREIANELIQEELGSNDVPPPPAVCNSIEGARYRDRLSKMSVRSEDSISMAKAIIYDALRPFDNIYHEASLACDGEEDTFIPISYYIEDLHGMVNNCTWEFYQGDYFQSFRRFFDSKMEAAGKNGQQLFPQDYPYDDVIDVYLTGTPLKKLFNIDVPFAIPEKYRTHHHFILGGSGHGKTQCLQHYIARDVYRVVHEREMSMIVIDSQGDLINKIRQLDGLNGDNTIIIDPEDVEFPVALNLFDIKRDRLDGYSPLAKERQLNGIIELYDYVLGALLSADMTQKQEVLFRYVTRLLLTVPDATIHTMLDLFQEGAMDRYGKYIEQLDPVAKTFFYTEFASKEFNHTRREVTRRLFGILENQSFTRMFTNPKSKIDLFTEMNSGKVILINTAKSLLKEEGTEIFGRFFIAMITQAAQEREEMPENERMPCMVYIDEASDYGFDDKIDLILTQARKYKVGLVMATQYLDKISPRLQSAIAANTAIKFAGGASNRDARRMAPDMRCDAEFIEEQPTLTFAAYVRGLTPKAVPLTFEAGYLEGLPKSPKATQRELLAANRAKYADSIYAEPTPEQSEVKEPEAEAEPEAAPVKGDGFVMAESVPDDERMEKPKERDKVDPEDVPEKGTW
jgi:hypothetical protein